jgi:hypothetical protein
MITFVVFKAHNKQRCWAIMYQCWAIIYFNEESSILVLKKETLIWVLKTF